jgi:hypothetical protein
LILVIVD